MKDCVSVYNSSCLKSQKKSKDCEVIVKGQCVNRVIKPKFEKTFGLFSVLKSQKKSEDCEVTVCCRQDSVNLP